MNITLVILLLSFRLNNFLMKQIESISKEVWILDDDVNIHYLITDFVGCVDERKEYQTRNFFTNAGVLEALSYASPEVIFVDIDLKGDDGIKLLERMSKFGGFEDVQVYVISNFINRDNLKRLMSTGIMTDYIPKPVELEDIKQILSN